MRVLMVAENREKKPTPAIPLGLCCVAQAVREKSHEVKMLDLMFAEDIESCISEAIEGFDPEVIGISLRNLDDMDCVEPVFYPPAAKRVIDFIKSLSDAPIVAGGYMVSIAPADVLRYLDIEIGVVGEGEIVFPKLLERLESGREPASLPGVALLRNGEFIYKEPELIPDLNRLSPPALDLIDHPRYLADGSEACVQSKRGCPFNCVYCTIPDFEGSALRLREPSAVVDDIEKQVRDYGAEKFYFADNVFNFPPEHATAVCEEIVRRELKISWSSYFHPRFFDKNSAHTFKMSGCSLAIFNTGLLFANGSGADSGGLEKISEICRTLELPVVHYLVFGEPDHSPGMLKEICSIMEKVHPLLFYIVSKPRVYPNSRLARVTEEKCDDLGSLFEPKFYPHPAGDEIQAYAEEACREHKNWYYSMKISFE